MTALLTRVFGRLPLGWLQLLHNRPRLISAVFGVAFANILIFMQLGFMGAINETSVLMHHGWNADIVMCSSDYKSLREANSFPRARLHQALRVEGVADASPYYFSNINWTNSETGNAMMFRVVGVDPESEIYSEPSLQSLIPKLKEPRSAIIDRKTRDLAPDMLESIERSRNYEIEFANHAVKVIGTFMQGASIDLDGTIIVSDQTYLDYFPRQSSGTPTLGMIQCEPGADPVAVAKGINAALTEDDAKAMTRAAFIQAEKDYQTKVTPIGFVFGFGVVIGIIVGLVIVYQILTTDVQDHLGEYATFKAMGYTQGYFLGIVFEEAVALATLGFIPGFLVSAALYKMTENAIDLPLQLSPARALFVFALTLVMCGISGAIATRRLANAQPAELF